MGIHVPNMAYPILTYKGESVMKPEVKECKVEKGCKITAYRLNTFNMDADDFERRTDKLNEDNHELFKIKVVYDHKETGIIYEALGDTIFRYLEYEEE